jgi:hypothetical protein
MRMAAMNSSSTHSINGTRDLSRNFSGNFFLVISRSLLRSPFWRTLERVRFRLFFASYSPLSSANSPAVVDYAIACAVPLTLAFAMLRHRLGQKVFFWSVIETAKWTPMFVLFFGGISLHLSTAIVCHFLGIKMEWTATAKELETRGFRVGLDKIFKDFKYMYLFIIPIAAGKTFPIWTRNDVTDSRQGMIYLGIYAPRGFLITDFTAIVPLANQVGCHALLPVSLC